MLFRSKKYADKVIKKRWGIEVEHLKALKTYEEQFYSIFQKRKLCGKIYGFPLIHRSWCQQRLKSPVFNKIGGSFQYVGLAADESKRLAKLSEKKISPLQLIGWSESECREWCEENDLLSPIYTDSLRGGCWFCHFQRTEQLRLLRQKYPDYWEKLLQWDDDSDITFKPGGYTVHDFDLRFQMEDAGSIPTDKSFRWAMIKGEKQIPGQINIFDWMKKQ